jgi:hypothetical protein
LLKLRKHAKNMPRKCKKSAKRGCDAKKESKFASHKRYKKISHFRTFLHCIRIALPSLPIDGPRNILQKLVAESPSHGSWGSIGSKRTWKWQHMTALVELTGIVYFCSSSLAEKVFLVGLPCSPWTLQHHAFYLRRYFSLSLSFPLFTCLWNANQRSPPRPVSQCGIVQQVICVRRASASSRVRPRPRKKKWNPRGHGDWWAESLVV